MLQDDPQLLFERFNTLAKTYLDKPGIMAALELDRVCMQLYPLVARITADMELSNRIREFGRELPRKDVDELSVLLQHIFTRAQASGLTSS
jgi:hypothetical protein